MGTEAKYEKGLLAQVVKETKRNKRGLLDLVFVTAVGDKDPDPKAKVMYRTLDIISREEDFLWETELIPFWLQYGDLVMLDKSTYKVGEFVGISYEEHAGKNGWSFHFTFMILGTRPDAGETVVMSGLHAPRQLKLLERAKPKVRATANVVRAGIKI